MTRLTALLLLSPLALGCTTTREQPIILPRDAPPDKPLNLARSTDVEAYVAAAEPCVAVARATYPAAKARYLAGLAQGETFFVVVRLRDSEGRVEQAFVAVDSIHEDQIHGRIANEINAVSGFHSMQRIELSESELVDWVISMPDGTEEGNLLGKALDSGVPCQTPAGLD